jgi:hypothetical protein
VFLGIKVPAAGLDEYFREHLQANLDFVALGTENKEAGIKVNVLAKSSAIADHVLTVFGWNEGADLLYDK